MTTMTGDIVEITVWPGPVKREIVHESNDPGDLEVVIQQLKAEALGMALLLLPSLNRVPDLCPGLIREGLLLLRVVRRAVAAWVVLLFGAGARAEVELAAWGGAVVVMEHGEILSRPGRVTL